MRLLIEKKFAELFPGKKGKWQTITPGMLAKNPELADELFKLLTTAYAKIGGHFEIRKAGDFVAGDLNVFSAVDVDEDDEPDAMKFGKTTAAGEKSTGGGNDGTEAGKKAYLDKSVADLKTAGHYAEMSDAIAHIMLTRFNVTSVNDQETVEKVLGKKVEWIGKNEKYPNNPGWYRRKVSGHDHVKILLGLPLVTPKKAKAEKTEKKESAAGGPMPLLIERALRRHTPAP